MCALISARAFASRLADLRALAPIGARGQVAPSALPRGAPAALPYPTPPQPRRPAPVQVRSHPAVHLLARVCDWWGRMHKEHWYVRMAACDWWEGCTRSFGASEWQPWSLGAHSGGANCEPFVKKALQSRYPFVRNAGQNDDRQSTTDMRGPRGSLVTSRPEKIVVNNGGWGQLLPQSARLFQNVFCAPCNSRRI